MPEPDISVRSSLSTAAPTRSRLRSGWTRRCGDADPDVGVKVVLSGEGGIPQPAITSSIIAPGASGSESQ